MANLIIDMHNLMHRAAHAYSSLWSYNTRTGEKEFTGLYHGIFMMMSSYVKLFSPDYIFICSDFKQRDNSWRHQLYPEYKAARKKDRKPEDQRRYDAINNQADTLRWIFQHMRVAFLEAPGYEADDIIATLVTRELAGQDNTIVSTDKDLWQLTPYARVYYPGQKKVIDLNPVMFSAEVAEYINAKNKPGDRVLYLNTPESWVIYRALLGDSSDNIPSIAGMGPKRVKEFMLAIDYRSVAEGIEHVKATNPKMAGTKWFQELCSEEGQSTYHRNLELMRLPNPRFTKRLPQLRDTNYTPYAKQLLTEWALRCFSPEMKQLSECLFLQRFA